VSGEDDGALTLFHFMRRASSEEDGGAILLKVWGYVLHTLAADKNVEVLLALEWCIISLRDKQAVKYSGPKRRLSSGPGLIITPVDGNGQRLVLIIEWVAPKALS
jgi:hypothetical protein